VHKLNKPLDPIDAKQLIYEPQFNVEFDSVLPPLAQLNNKLLVKGLLERNKTHEDYETISRSQRSQEVSHINSIPD
jgi:hypothetical protein